VVDVLGETGLDRELQVANEIGVTVTPNAVTTGADRQHDLKVSISRPAGMGCVRVEYRDRTGASRGPHPEPVRCGGNASATLEVAINPGAPAGTLAGHVRVVAVDAMRRSTGREGSAPATFAITRPMRPS
jgi:hypothetical protein